MRRISVSARPSAKNAVEQTETLAMPKLDTIPAAEEGEALLRKKPTGIRRVVAAAAAVAFLIGVLAATAVHTSPSLDIEREAGF